MPAKTAKWMGVELPTDVKLTVEHKQRNTLGRFQAISPFSTSTKNEKYDLLELFVQLPPASQRLFVGINHYRDTDTNYACYPLPFENRSGNVYKLHSRALTQLKKLGFLKQLKSNEIIALDLSVSDDSQLFLINPHIIRCSKFNTAKHFWRRL